MGQNQPDPEVVEAVIEIEQQTYEDIANETTNDVEADDGQRSGFE